MTRIYGVEMNYLAHVLLSPRQIDFQLGNLLADPLKGRPWPGASSEHLAGLKLHRQIDAFTDAHPMVARSVARLGKTGRLRGVVVDVVYDYLLHQHWSQFVRCDKSVFLQTFAQEALAQVVRLPLSVQTMVERLVQHRVLESYQTIAGIEIALSRLDYRLSKRMLAHESTSQYAPLLSAVLPDMAVDFQPFFADLIAELQPRVVLPHLRLSRE